LDKLFTTADLCSLGRQARWVQLLANFNFTVQYLPGAKNVVADCLSRPSPASRLLSGEGVPVASLVQAALSPPQHLYTALEIDICPDFISEIKAGYLACPELKPFVEADPAAVVPAWLQDGSVVCLEGLLYLQQGDGDLQGMRLVIPPVEAVTTYLLGEAHDSPLSGHLGRDKTFAKLQALFVWQGMYEQVNQYVLTCLSCQQSKKSNVLPPGKAKMLPIPNQKWECISMDFITGLPKSKQGNDSIWTIVDKLSKRVHFLPVKSTITAVQCAELFKDEVFRLHGMPKSILSDRDAKFTSAFWRQFCKILGIKQVLSTPFHPQSDGQSEIANRSIETMLRAYVDGRQSNWQAYLAVMEFAYNDSVHSGTGFTPFFLEYGCDPVTPLALINQAGLKLQTKGPLGTVHAAVYTCSQIQESLQEAKHSIKQAQLKQQKAIDRQHSSVSFKAGDSVWLLTKHLQLPWVGESKKLRLPWVGPFTILSMKGDNAAELDLPATMKCHPVQNISKIKHCRVAGEGTFASRAAPPPSILFEDGHEEFEVEEILGKRGKGGKVQYLVKWLGYPVADCQWQHSSTLKNAWDCVLEYEASASKRTR
jgi:Integrase zinc binding domain/Integrase core domain/Chromo (CHRromatin Organisation MOdifier) domain